LAFQQLTFLVALVKKITAAVVVTRGSSNLYFFLEVSSSNRYEASVASHTWAAEPCSACMYKVKVIANTSKGVEFQITLNFAAAHGYTDEVIATQPGCHENL
jgi:formamidopyrimidine-DNA glycosylase